MKARLAVNALDNAVPRRGDVAGNILHSDGGSRSSGLASKQLALAAHSIVGLIGQFGSGGAKAAMESFFALPREQRSRSPKPGTPATRCGSRS